MEPAQPLLFEDIGQAGAKFLLGGLGALMFVGGLYLVLFEEMPGLNLRVR